MMEIAMFMSLGAAASAGRSRGVAEKTDGGQDTALKAACDAVRQAISAFDEAVAQGNAFDRLCELSEAEHRAVEAACAARASTPTGIAEKALLLDRVVADGKHSDATVKTLAIALASDALALAKSMIVHGRER